MQPGSLDRASAGTVPDLARPRTLSAGSDTARERHVAEIKSQLALAAEIHAGPPCDPDRALTAAEQATLEKMLRGTRGQGKPTLPALPENLTSTALFRIRLTCTLSLMGVADKEIAAMSRCGDDAHRAILACWDVLAPLREAGYPLTSLVALADTLIHESIGTMTPRQVFEGVIALRALRHGATGRDGVPEYLPSYTVAECSAIHVFLERLDAAASADFPSTRGD